MKEQQCSLSLKNKKKNSQTEEGKHNQNNSIKFGTEAIKSILCDYSNCAPCSTCKTEINDVFIGEAKYI